MKKYSLLVTLILFSTFSINAEEEQLKESEEIFASCKEIKEAAKDAESKVYEIKVHNKPMFVYCDMDKVGGGFNS